MLVPRSCWGVCKGVLLGASGHKAADRWKAVKLAPEAPDVIVVAGVESLWWVVVCNMPRLRHESGVKFSLS